MFQRLYDRVLSWSAHRHAPAYLSALSFTESSFFPIPPDVMLIPMCLARHKQSWYYATLCTASSVLGGMAGYLAFNERYDPRLDAWSNSDTTTIFSRLRFWQINWPHAWRKYAGPYADIS